MISMTDHQQRPLAALDGASVWLNSEPLTAAGLRGHVVLVDFWTYSCVNWLRTLPYVRAWHERYRDRGLVVVGVHAPEFGFEHDLDNVRHAVGRARRRLPGRDRQRLRHLACRSRTTTGRPCTSWTATGRVRFHHFGEEAYRRPSGRSSGSSACDEELVRVDAGGLAESADWERCDPRRPIWASPAVSVASKRPGRGARAQSSGRSAASGRSGEEAAVLDAAGARSLSLRGPRDLNMVLAPLGLGRAGPLRVRLDGEPPGDDHGSTSTRQEQGYARRSRGCTSWSAATPSAERTFEITFHGPACAPTSSPSVDLIVGRRPNRNLDGERRSWPRVVVVIRSPCQPVAGADCPWSGPGRVNGGLSFRPSSAAVEI